MFLTLSALTLLLGSYLIQISWDKGDGVAGSCHFNETAVHCVSHRGVLVHTVEQVTEAEMLNMKHRLLTVAHSEPSDL